jgi:hypothetical protein
MNRYQSLLRVSMLVTAMVLLFDSGFVFPITKELSDTTISYLASVGSSVTATIPPNGINELTAEIADRNRELDLREAALNEREIAARDFGVVGESDYSTYILSAILFILTVLLVLNYAMDWARARELYGQPVR